MNTEGKPTNYFRYQFQCGCEFLTEAVCAHMLEIDPAELITCILHKTRVAMVCILDDNRQWEPLYMYSRAHQVARIPEACGDSPGVRFQLDAQSRAWFERIEAEARERAPKS